MSPIFSMSTPEGDYPETEKKMSNEKLFKKVENGLITLFTLDDLKCDCGYHHIAITKKAMLENVMWFIDSDSETRIRNGKTEYYHFNHHVADEDTVIYIEVDGKFIDLSEKDTFSFSLLKKANKVYASSGSAVLVYSENIDDIKIFKYDNDDFLRLEYSEPYEGFDNDNEVIKYNLNDIENVKINGHYDCEKQSWVTEWVTESEPYKVHKHFLTSPQTEITEPEKGELLGKYMKTIENDTIIFSIVKNGEIIDTIKSFDVIHNFTEYNIKHMNQFIIIDCEKVTKHSYIIKIADKNDSADYVKIVNAYSEISEKWKKEEYFDDNEMIINHAMDLFFHNSAKYDDEFKVYFATMEKENLLNEFKQRCLKINPKLVFCY